MDITGVLSLERRRDVARLCLLYKIVNHLCFFDLNAFSSCTSRSYHSHLLALTLPLSHTNSFYNSYVPATIRLWNNLDSITCSAPSYFHLSNNLYLYLGVMSRISINAIYMHSLLCAKLYLKKEEKRHLTLLSIMFFCFQEELMATIG